jgi:hypothetical protein
MCPLNKTGGGSVDPSADRSMSSVLEVAIKPENVFDRALDRYTRFDRFWVAGQRWRHSHMLSPLWSPGTAGSLHLRGQNFDLSVPVRQRQRRAR